MITLSPDNIRQMKAWRHDFHAHPELAYEETRTAGIVADHMRSLGAEVTPGIAKTGVVGVFDFGAGPIIGIRADMDALPMSEHNDLPYRSTYCDVMHACGHDAHTSMAMGAASEIAKLDGLRGKVVFIFQPAEENEGGAKAMVEDGLFDRFPVDQVYGLHNMPGVPVGHVGVRAGSVSAAYSTFDIRVEGKGGHGAMPELARDPVAASGALISAINNIVSRNVPPLDSAVISIGTVRADGAFNIIPDTASLTGSMRNFSVEIGELIKSRLSEVCGGIATAYGVDISVNIEERYPPVVNALAPTKNLIKAVRNSLPHLSLEEDIKPVMGSEDFSFFSQAVPGCFFLIGNGDSAPLHSPQYDFCDEALEIGASIWVGLTKSLLS